jgi:hypothetical protein
MYSIASSVQGDNCPFQITVLSNTGYPFFPSLLFSVGVQGLLYSCPRLILDFCHTPCLRLAKGKVTYTRNLCFENVPACLLAHLECGWVRPLVYELKVNILYHAAVAPQRAGFEGPYRSPYRTSSSTGQQALCGG